MVESLWNLGGGGPPPAEADLLKALAVTQPQPEAELVLSNLPPERRRAQQLAIDHLHDLNLIRQAEGGWKFTIPLYREWIRRYILNLPGANGTEERS